MSCSTLARFGLNSQIAKPNGPTQTQSVVDHLNNSIDSLLSTDSSSGDLNAKPDQSLSTPSSQSNLNSVSSSTDFHANLQIHQDAATLLNGILCSSSRAQTILKICKTLNYNPNLCSLIYSQPGILAALLLEITRHYPQIGTNAKLSEYSIEVIGSIVAIFQQTILDKHLCTKFLSTNLLFYLLPFLNVESPVRSAEFLRASLLGLYATVASKLTTADMEFYLIEPFEYFDLDGDMIPSLVCSGQLVHYVCGGLCASSAIAILKCNSEVGKVMALILLTRLLKSTKQLETLNSNLNLLILLMNSLDSIVTFLLNYYFDSYLVTDSTIHRQPNKTLSSLSWIKAKRLLHFTLDCYTKIVCDPKLRSQVAASIPVQLRSDLFVGLFNNDCDVNQWLQLLWFRLGIHFPF